MSNIPIKFYSIKEKTINQTFLFSDSNSIDENDKVGSVFIEGFNSDNGIYLKQLLEKDLEKFISKYEFTGELKGAIPLYRRKYEHCNKNTY